MSLEVLSCGPAVSLQGPPRRLGVGAGLPPGGAMDPLALREAAALLGGPVGAAVEMGGAGGRFRVRGDLRLALTGAPMRALARAPQGESRPLAWAQSHALPAGTEIEIGGALAGRWGYLALAGGLAAPGPGLEAALAPGAVLVPGPDPAPGAPARRLVAPRDFGGALRLRLLAGPQSAFFAADVRAALAARPGRLGARMSRQGAPIAHPAAPFASRAQGLLSDFVIPGDLQMVGAGEPVALLADGQTIGGYPRIGTILAADLPALAQGAPGAQVWFEWVDPAAAAASGAWPRTAPVARDPRLREDLAALNLIGGVIDARAPEA